ncbi:MAG: hypothetical protein ACI8PB_000869 [Desulforhopalus sp.]|jgi:hypothetical protein
MEFGVFLFHRSEAMGYKAIAVLNDVLDKKTS